MSHFGRKQSSEQGGGGEYQISCFCVVATAEAATELGLDALRSNSLQSTSAISGYRKFAVIGNQQ
jgi:hypothetical protein